MYSSPRLDADLRAALGLITAAAFVFAGVFFLALLLAAVFFRVPTFARVALVFFLVAALCADLFFLAATGFFLAAAGFFLAATGFFLAAAGFFLAAAGFFLAATFLPATVFFLAADFFGRAATFFLETDVVAALAMTVVASAQI